MNAKTKTSKVPKTPKTPTNRLGIVFVNSGNDFWEGNASRLLQAANDSLPKKSTRADLLQMLNLPADVLKKKLTDTAAEPLFDPRFKSFLFPIKAMIFSRAS